nr:hypothetical protein [Tanacetum cinerariifolium]
MILYLKNTEGYKMDFFKGMKYNEILLIFQAKFDANIRFLFKSREEMEEEDEEIIKSINETPAQKEAKRRKLHEQAKEDEDLKKLLEVVDDDVFIEATPIGRKDLHKAKEEEEETLAREKAQQIKEVNIALDDIQAKIDADYQLAQRLVNTFVDYKTELVVKSSKQAEAEVIEELKQCLEIIPKDGNDVTIDATPLSFKSPTIVDYKIHNEGRKSYFQIFRADGNSQMYLTFSKMLKNFGREDLKVLWRLVKARFEKIKRVDYMDNLLLHNLKTMFAHHVEDNVWKNQQGLVKVLNWKLCDSCGVHCVTLQSDLRLFTPF